MTSTLKIQYCLANCLNTIIILAKNRTKHFYFRLDRDGRRFESRLDGGIQFSV
nr:MAG TPA: hypothetical protein [Caudoviricetes sp.]